MRITACNKSSDVQMLTMTRKLYLDIFESNKQVVSSFNIKLTETNSQNYYLIYNSSYINLK